MYIDFHIPGRVMFFIVLNPDLESLGKPGKIK